MNNYLNLILVAAIFIAKCNTGLIGLRDDIENYDSIKEKSGLPTCDSTESGKKCMNSGDSGSYCIKNNKIYRNDYNECYLINTNDLDGYVISFDQNYSKSYGYGTSMAYKCTLDTTNYVDYCQLIKGYIIKYDSVVHCNAIDDECEEISYPDECKEGDEGVIGKEVSEDYSSNKQFKLCFGTDGVLIPSRGDFYSFNNYIAFITTKINKIYGKHDANEIIVLKVSTTDVIEYTLKDGEEKYFINQNYQLSNPESKPLIKCNGPNCVALDMPEVTDGEVYYLDGYNKKNIITCNSDGCTSENKCNNVIYPKYFIDNDNKKNIIKCTSEGCTSNEAKQGVYIQDKNYFDATKNLIMCTNADGCKYIENKNVCTDEGDEGNIYSDRISFHICTAETSWKKIGLDRFDNKFLISNDLASKLFDKVSNDYILITGEASSIVYEEKPINGYYKNGDSTETDIPFIQCNSKACKAAIISESCTQETVGTLIKSGNDVGLCIEENNVVLLNKYSEAYIYYNSKNNIFELTSDQYALINIAPQSVTLKDLNSPLTYYVNTDTTKNTKPLIKSQGSLYTYINPYTSKRSFFIDGNDKKNIITCEGSKCTSKKATFGYYLNGGEDKDTYNFLYCQYYHGCNKELITTSTCKSGMDVITKDNKYYVCLTDNGSKTAEIKVDDPPVPVYEKITNCERISLLNGSYTGDYRTKFDIKIGNDGSVLLLTKAALTGCINLSKANECVSEPCPKKCYPTAYGGEYCIGNDAIIRYTKASATDVYSCQVIDNKGFTATNVSGNIKLHFFNEFYEIINEITPGRKDINIAYKCTYNSANEITNCEIASGSFIINGNKIDCTGYRQDYCTVTDKFDSPPTDTTTPSTNTSNNDSASTKDTTTTPSGSDTGTKPSSSPSLTTIDDDNKNEGSGALSSYYKLPSFIFYVILLILTILYHM